jgi:hypothetical protein
MPRLQMTALTARRLPTEAMSATALIVFMVLLRLGFSLLGWPGTDSEEGTMGLMALHIARGQDWPIFYYGQHYMGAGEAYIGALMFHLFGVSLLSLRLAMLVFVVIFALAIYQLAALLYGKWVALLTLAIVSLAPRYILTPEMRAVGGAVETLAFGSLAVLLASWLVLSYDAAPTSGRSVARSVARKRLVGYFAWGLVAGLSLWSHWLVVPYLGVSALLLLLFCWREWQSGPALLFLVLGFCLGGLPLIIYNLQAPPGQNSLSVFLALYSGRNMYPGVPPQGLLLLLKKLDGTFLYSLPLATGMSPICPLTSLPLYGWQPGESLSCAFIYGGWSLAYLALLTAALLVTVGPLWQLWRAHMRSPGGWLESARQQLVLQTARLLFLLGGILTLLAYANSLAAAQRPQSQRYLVGMLIITPALIWPLARHLPDSRSRPPGLATTRAEPLPTALSASYLRQVVAITALVMILLVFGASTLDNVEQIPTAAARQQQYIALVGTLTRMGIRHVYSGYWVCDRLTFASQERIICGAIDPWFGPATPLRYPPYYQAVRADPRAAYLFSTNDEFPLLSSQVRTLAARHYRPLQLPGFVLYVPAGST